MPRLKTRPSATGDQSWLGSTHGIGNARTESIDISTFTAGTHYPNGYIPSGTPVAKVGGLLVPYDVTEGTTTGAGILAGFILTDQPVVGTDRLRRPAPRPRSRPSPRCPTRRLRRARRRAKKANDRRLRLRRNERWLSGLTSSTPPR
jgi:hypothetical protein